MSDLKAFQVEVTSGEDGSHRVFFVAADAGETAIEILAGHLGTEPGPAFKLQRRLSDSEIDLHQIGPDTVVQYL